MNKFQALMKVVISLQKPLFFVSSLVLREAGRFEFVVGSVCFVDEDMGLAVK